MKRILSLLISTIVMLACNEQPQTAGSVVTDSGSNKIDVDEVRSLLLQENARYVAAILAGDSVTAADHYTSDAIVLAPNTKALQGREILAYYGSFLRAVDATDGHLNTETLTGDAEHIIETGNYDLYIQNGQLVDKGKYLGVWKREDGKWRIFRTAFNTDLPEVAR